MSKYLTRFDPFVDLARFEPMRSVEDFFRDFHLKHSLRDLEAPVPIRLDVAETDKAYTIKAEMPGVNKEDIKIDVEGNQVSIAAESRRETQSKDGATVLRTERHIGQHYRSFTLEHDIDDAKAEAKYRDGVLELTLPKRSNGKGAKKLTVN